ncbi:MAG: FecR family protein [Chitinophagaceae bacterium]|nr:FecR family protein [Chitinophagaceae bacterium]
MPERIKYLIHQKITERASNDEAHELDMLWTEANRDIISAAIAELLSSDNQVLPEDRAGWELRIRQVVSIDLPASKPVHRMFFLRRWGWAAAAVITMLGLVTYFWAIDKKNNASIPTVVQGKNILPGKEGAILSLADGSQVSLDTVKNATIALQGGAMAKVVNGRLMYESTGQEIVYNTLSTPAGRSYHLSLPDGTIVWLNAASSIRYPTVFAEAERRVEVHGEAFFEVTENRSMPFKVMLDGGTTVQVLGTHFNINSYDNEPKRRITLLEGSVEVSTSDRKVVLKPAQQALIPNLSTAKNIDVISDVDLQQVIAWKNGYFQPDKADIETIMKEVERWYDVQVAYEGSKPVGFYKGKIRRDASLAEMMEIIAASGVHYRIEGRKIIIFK